LISLLLLAYHPLQAQQDSIPAENLGLIRWMSLEEAEIQNAKYPKPFMIDVYTDWCGWCKTMMKTTFSNPDLAGYINLNFYPVRFNAETQDTVVFRGQKFWNPSTENRSTHQLAIKLLNGKLTYPTIVYFNNNYQFNLIVPGYFNERDIQPFLVYAVEYVFNTTTIQDFRDAYMKSLAPDTLRKDTTSIRWMSFEAAVAKSKEKPKKILTLVNTKWCNSGRIFKDVIFKDSAVVSTVNELFYAAYIDAEAKDTIRFKGEAYVNDGKYGTFHNFAVVICNNKLTLPSVVYIDSNLDVITSVPQFYGVNDLLLILRFFGKDYYKTMSWEDFRKTQNTQGEPTFEQNK
jgi:thioredoxin-related protein